MTDRFTLDRRRFLQVSGAAVATLSGGLALARTARARGLSAAAGSAAAGTAPPTTPIRPPATPLIVRSPYLSTWQPSTESPGTWQMFWNGDTTGMAGIVRIDGTAYTFAGDPYLGATAGVLEQTQLAVTASRSVYTFQGGGVQLTVEYLSPIEPGDLERQSIPMAWVLVTVQSIDGAAHDVGVYLDITGEWLSGDPDSIRQPPTKPFADVPITWAPTTVPFSGGTIQAWTIQLAQPQVLAEIANRAQWGTIVLAAPQEPGLTFQSGASEDVRTQFVEQGVLLDTDDTTYTSISGDGYPSFGLAFDLGQIDGQAQTRQFSLGEVRTPLVSYLGRPLQPLWTEYYADWQDMLAFFHGDIDGARTRASNLDAKVTRDATRVGGAQYAALCALAVRQTYGATELAVGPDRLPWAFLKEIASDGDTATVDVTFPASPLWLYLDPQYLSLLLRPIFAYAHSSHWTAPYAPHDLGPYPTASGYPHNGGENMPVEESGNMLIMAAAYTRAAPGTTALVYLQDNYTLLKRWADYLVDTLPNVGLQNQTDDFAGKIAHSVNLALKGIVGVAAMSQIAEACGQPNDVRHYRAQAKTFMTYWLKHSGATGHSHLGLTYRRRRAWGNTYNAFPDAMLGTGLVPESVAALQAKFYATKLNRFGLPLQTPHTYGKTDWQMWLAAWLRDYPISKQLIQHVYHYADTTPARVPFCDLYSTETGKEIYGFQARPVQGGVFALLALHALAGRES